MMMRRSSSRKIGDAVKIIRVSVVVAVLAMVSGLPPAAAAQSVVKSSSVPGYPTQPGPASLSGTWDVTLTIDSASAGGFFEEFAGATIPAVMSVLPVQTANEGTVIQIVAVDPLKPNPTTTQLGTWVRSRGNEFLLAYSGFSVTDDFTAPAGRIAFRHRITVSDKGDSFVGSLVIEALDIDGISRGTASVTSVGKRQHPSVP